MVESLWEVMRVLGRYCRARVVSCCRHSRHLHVDKFLIKLSTVYSEYIINAEYLYLYLEYLIFVFI